MATLRVTNLRGRSANVAPNLTDGVNVTGVGTVSSRLELGAIGIGATIHGNGNEVFAGVTVTGNAVATSKFRGNDGVKLSLGDSEDLQIQHDGSNAIIDSTTGNITGTTGTFSGDVSVGGTLSYEDVQNIDSVGLITARSGIKIGPSASIGATFNPAGDLVIAGIITAGTFDGVVSGIALQADGSDVSSGTAATMMNFSGATITDVTAGFSTITIAAGITTTYQYAQSGVITINLGTGQAHEVTLAAGISTFTCTGGTAGESHSLIITQPSSGITTVGFSTYFLWPSGSVPNLSRGAASSEIDLISFIVKQQTQTGTGVTQLLASAGMDHQ